MCVHRLINHTYLDIEDDLPSDLCDYEDLNNQVLSNSSDLTIIQHNIRGLNSKLGDIDYLLSHTLAHGTPDIALLCETWLTPNSPKPLISGYTIERADRLHKKGGGVCILLSSRCKYKRRHDLEGCGETQTESCFIELKNWNSNIILGSLYRPPNSDIPSFLEKLESTIRQVRHEKKRLIIGMDHNLDLLKESSHPPTHQFLELIYENGIVPTITKPTRVTTETATLIDNILMDQDLGRMSKSGVLLDHSSDHLPCYCVIPNINPSKKEPMKITSRDMREKNMKALKRKLEDTDLLLPLNKQTLDERFDHFHSELIGLIDHFLPTKTRTITRNSIRQHAWVTAGLMISIKKCKLLYKRFIKDRTNATKWNRYQNYNNQLKRTKRLAKRKYFYDKCEEHKNNMKKLWKTINVVTKSTNNKTEVIERLKIGDKYKHNGNKISEEFAKHFANVGKKFATQMPDSKKLLRTYTAKIPTQQNSIYLEPMTETEINKLINNLPSKKSSGTDNIDNILLKELRPYLLGPLTSLFNESLTTGHFPTSMKTAKVIPLYKNKCKEEATNYRPISLLLTVSKILEKIMYKRVYGFLTSTNQLYASQYGFRKKHGCDHAVGELISNISKGIEQGKLTAGVFLDLSKAFDSLEHTTIFHKMELYGLRGTCLEWFRSYLKDRKLQVSCRTSDTGELSSSGLHNVEYGTAQGSCLGPLIFLIIL